MDTLENYDRETAILRNGAISLYRKLEILSEDIEWFERNGYQSFTFNCLEWTSSDVIFQQMEERLALPQRAANFDAFEDDLCEIDLHGGDSFLFVFYEFDKFVLNYAKDSKTVLDILARVSRLCLIDRVKIILLLHVGDSYWEPIPIGCIFPGYNFREG